MVPSYCGFNKFRILASSPFPPAIKVWIKGQSAFSVKGQGVHIGSVSILPF